MSKTSSEQTVLEVTEDSAVCVWTRTHVRGSVCVYTHAVLRPHLLPFQPGSGPASQNRLNRIWKGWSLPPPDRVGWSRKEINCLASRNFSFWNGLLEPPDGWNRWMTVRLEAERLKGMTITTVIITFGAVITHSVENLLDARPRAEWFPFPSMTL